MSRPLGIVLALAFLGLLANIQPTSSFAANGNVTFVNVARRVSAETDWRSFRKTTLDYAAKGSIEELKAIRQEEQRKASPDQTRVSWVNYLVNATTLHQAGKAGGEKFVTAVSYFEKSVAQDESLHEYLGDYLNIIASYSAAEGAAVRKRLATVFRTSADQTRQKMAAELESGKLVVSGTQLKLEGVFLDGTSVDWSEYRGKVVLVDFWATWCGPCVAEIPNVMALYEKYHAAGFEVVGYSLDTDLNALKKFVADRGIPWKTVSRLLSDDPAQAQNRTYPELSKYYGIKSIPTMYVIDREGRIVETNARGKRLGEILKEQFPEVE